MRALIHAKGRAADSTPGACRRYRALVATMETTPSLPALKGVPAEADAIEAIIADNCRVTRRAQPNAETVLQLMSSNDIFHFAGHGISDPADPAHSRLIFEKTENPSAPPVEDRLQVEQLLGVDFQSALLAFLSACSTAENKQERMADESIHLGSAFLIAGFRHVIGCLWPSSDGVCVDVAREFYRELDIRSGGSVQDVAFARALHVAVGKVYTVLREHPLLWAQYVHIGA